MTTFGEKLRYLREEQELWQDHLATALQKKYPDAGFTRALIGNYETDRHLPRIDKAVMLSEFFKVSMDDLFKPKVSIKTLIKNREMNHEKV